METLISQNMDVILLDAIDPLGGVALVKQAVAAGIPVIEVIVLLFIVSSPSLLCLL